MTLSVLIPVYKKEQPAHLADCFDSLLAQTRRADEIVLVEDGALTEELYRTIEAYEDRLPELHRVALPKQDDLGAVLANGVNHCSGEFVARMDSDDICLPRRFELELSYLQTHPDISVVGAWIDEFQDSADNILSSRCVPEEHNAILHFAHYRNPINHPSVMFRRKDILECGNYQDFFYFEDYALWCRMLQKGKKFHNLQESLVLFRSGRDLFERRGGMVYIKSEIRFQRYLCMIGFCNVFQFLLNVSLRSITRLLPNTLRSWFYIYCLRKPKSLQR